MRAGISNNRTAGFTLVELAVVLLLFGLFVVLVMPSLGTWGTGSFSTATRRLSSEIRSAYNESALTGKRHRMTFDLDSQTYQVKILEPRGDYFEEVAIAAERHLPSSIRLETVHVGSRSLSGRGRIDMDFWPIGWADPAALLLKQGDTVRTVEVISLTGMVEIYDGDREE